MREQIHRTDAARYGAAPGGRTSRVRAVLPADRRSQTSNSTASRVVDSLEPSGSRHYPDLATVNLLVIATVDQLCSARMATSQLLQAGRTISALSLRQRPASRVRGSTGRSRRRLLEMLDNRLGPTNLVVGITESTTLAASIHARSAQPHSRRRFPHRARRLRHRLLVAVVSQNLPIFGIKLDRSFIARESRHPVICMKAVIMLAHRASASRSQPRHRDRGAV